MTLTAGAAGPAARRSGWRRLLAPARAVRRAGHQAWFDAQPPRYAGSKMTLRRFLNYQIVRWQEQRLHTRLRGYPLLLTIEATNACNLRCPYCFTGVGEAGRDRSMLEARLYHKLLDELGGCLLAIEFYNWGEPLLHKGIAPMIRAAADRGISTQISTNFSLKFDAERARELVASGLALLGVSLDGATQEVYEQYRRRGDLATVLDNVRLINEAKRELGSKTPNVVWEYHVFPHNRHEIEDARRLAGELGMTYVVSKGWVAGPDWDIEREFVFPYDDDGPGCAMLWRRAVVHNDGAVAPCCSTFYREDDYGAVSSGEPGVPLSALASKRFRDVWNNGSFRRSRALFRDRDAASAETTKLICYECPITVTKTNLRKHLAAGQPRDAFEPMGDNDVFNYFFGRRPARPSHNGARTDGVIATEDIPANPPPSPVHTDV